VGQGRRSDPAVRRSPDRALSTTAGLQGRQRLRCRGDLGSSLGAGLLTAPPAGPHGLLVFGRPSVEGVSRSGDRDTASRSGVAASGRRAVGACSLGPPRRWGPVGRGIRFRSALRSPPTRRKTRGRAEMDFAPYRSAASGNALPALDFLPSCGTLLTPSPGQVSVIPRHATTFLRDLTTFPRHLTTFLRDLTAFLRRATPFPWRLTTVPAARALVNGGASRSRRRLGTAHACCLTPSAHGGRSFTVAARMEAGPSGGPPTASAGATGRATALGLHPLPAPR